MAPATPIVAETPSAPATETPAPSPTPAAPAFTLDAKWAQDSDGNAIPDFIEAELGYDPAVNDCPFDSCGTPAGVEDFLPQQRNILLMLDASGSMAGRVGGQSKIEIAKTSLTRYVQAAGSVYTLGFLVYGHKGDNTEAGKAESCAGIDVLAPIGQVDRTTFPSLLDRFEPTGWTPIAAALTEAGAAFAPAQNVENRIILVSDGIETCGGDPVAVAQELHARDLAVTIDVVGFDIQDREAVEQLRKVALVTGGTYTDAKTQSELDAFLQDHAAALEQSWDALQCHIRNISLNQGCENKQLLSALEYINGHHFNKLVGTKNLAELNAYLAVKNAIQAHFAASRQSHSGEGARANAAVQQIFTLQRQVREAYGME